MIDDDPIDHGTGQKTQRLLRVECLRATEPARMRQFIRMAAALDEVQPVSLGLEPVTKSGCEVACDKCRFGSPRPQCIGQGEAPGEMARADLRGRVSSHDDLHLEIRSR